MITQTALLIALGLAVIILATLLFIRISTERRQHSAIQGMNVAEFSDFLRTNSLDGKILMVAAKVSDVLKGVCGCERIIFLRKQRGMLELNYYFGINRFSRSEFRVKFTQEFAQQLRSSFVPQALDSLRPFFPAATYGRIEELQFDRYFPIFWRDNLYGVYFIKSNPKTSAQAFEVIVAGLAHSLSAAYHVRWHENRYEKLQQRQNIAETTRTSWSRTQQSGTHQIIKLVRNRNTETIIPRLVETVQKELGAQRMAFIYEGKGAAEQIRVQKGGGAASAPEAPDSGTFQELLSDLNTSGVKSLDTLAAQGGSAGPWVEHLKQQGFRHLAAFSLSGTRHGLLALEGRHLPMDLGQRLRQLNGPVQDLFHNAEAFEQLEELSFTDGLTGLANQRYFRRRLSEEVNRAKRYKRSLALIMFDLDELKAINDTYGHLAGDTVLSQLGPILRSSIRGIDIVARYGGDEFCIIMPEADCPTCTQFMQRIQGTVAGSVFKTTDTNQELHCTISLGGAVVPLHADDADKLIFAADMALLKAKAQGRNQYILFCPDTMVGTTTEH